MPHELQAGQAAGLAHAAMLAPAQLIALASHGDPSVELPLLWALCSAYVRSGHQVAVVDGSALETPGNPGLAQICEGTFRPIADVGLNDWLVLPAQTGLAAAYVRGVPPDALPDLICSALPNRSMVILYASAQSLASIFPGGQLTALVTLSPRHTSRVSAYETIKLLWDLAMIRTTVISVEVGANQDAENFDEGVCKNLRDCVMNFLGYRPDAFGLAIAVRNEFEWTRKMDKIAVFLLERSIRLPLRASGAATFGGKEHANQMTGWRH